MKKRKWSIIASAALALALLLGASVPVTAQTNLTITSISELERLYPMPDKAMAEIVHEIPNTEFVIIDGIKHPSEDVALYNGQRLRFVVTETDSMYAFTTVEGLQTFLDQRHELKPAPAAQGVLPDTIAWLYQNAFWIYEFEQLEPNQGHPYLWVDNACSSLKVWNGCEVALFDYPEYQGDYVYFLTAQPELATHGWNDRASSGIAFPIS